MRAPPTRHAAYPHDAPHLTTTRLSVRRQLEVARQMNPDVVGLHIGGSRLGTAYSLGARWATASAQYTGDARTGGDVYPAPQLRHELVMESGTKEEMPVFLCQELQTPMMIPVFVDRTDLARAWLASGRVREDFKEEQHLTVMDLRM